MKNPNKCRTKFCRGGRTKTGKSPYCSKCRNRRWREKYPLKYSFKNLRTRAKERGHAFNLTFEEYKQFAIGTGYFELKGKQGHSLSIDRIDPRKGYSADNIRAVTLAYNSRLRYAPLPDYLRAEMEKAESSEPF